MSDSTVSTKYVLSASRNFGSLDLLVKFVNGQLQDDPDCGIKIGWNDSIDGTNYWTYVVLESKWLAQEDSQQKFTQLLGLLGAGETKLYFRAVCSLAKYAKLSLLVVYNMSCCKITKSKCDFLDGECELKFTISEPVTKDSQLWQKLFEVMCS